MTKSLNMLRDLTLEMEAQVAEGIRLRKELDALWKLSPDLLCIAGMDGFMKRVNPAFERCLGYTEAELLTRPYHEFVHPDDAKTTLAESSRVSKGKNSLDIRNRWRTKDGKYRWMEWRSSTDPKASLIYAVARDVTDRLASDKKFEMAFGSAPIGMALVNTDGRWIKVNKKLCEIVGYSEAEMLATDFQSITHPDDLAADLNLMNQVLTGKIDHYTMKKRYISKSGSEIPITLHGYIVRDDDQHPQYFISHIVNG